MTITRVKIKKKDGTCIHEFNNIEGHSEHYLNEWAKVWCNVNYYNLEKVEKIYMFKTLYVAYYELEVIVS